MASRSLSRALARLACLLPALSGCAPQDEVEPWRAQLHAAGQAFRQQQYAQAREGYETALATAGSAGSEEGRMAALDGLATTFAVQGNLEKSGALYEELLTLQRRRFDADSLSGLQLVRTLGSLSEIGLRSGRIDRADSFLTEILDLHRSGRIDLRPEEGALAYTLHGLGQVRRARGDTAAADSLTERASGLQLYAQGFMRYVGEDYEQAEEAFRQSVARLQAVLGPDHVDVARAEHALGRLYELQGRHAEALTHYRRAVAGYDGDRSDPGAFAEALEDLAAAVAAEHPDEAARLRQRAAELLAGQRL